MRPIYKDRSYAQSDSPPPPQEDATTKGTKDISPRGQVTKYNLNHFFLSLSVMSWWIVWEPIMTSSVLAGGGVQALKSMLRDEFVSIKGGQSDVS